MQSLKEGHACTIVNALRPLYKLVLFYSNEQYTNLATITPTAATMNICTVNRNKTLDVF